MLKDWRIVVFLALALAFAVWIQWWASSGFILEHQICSEPNNQNDCASYNVLFYSAWLLGKAIDRWSALITAVATGAIGYFTWTIWRVHQNQLTHSHQIERAYISGGGSPEVRITNFGTQTVQTLGISTSGTMTVPIAPERTSRDFLKSELTTTGKLPGSCGAFNMDSARPTIFRLSPTSRKAIFTIGFSPE